MKKQAPFVNFGSAESRKYLITESAELSLILCGQEVCAPETQYFPKAQNFFLLHAIHSGKGACTVSGIQFDLDAQDLMLIFPGTEYSFAADPQEGCSFQWIAFTGIRAEECMLYAGFSMEHPCRRTTCLPQMEKILEQLLIPEACFSQQLRANGYFKIFLGDLMDEYAASEPESRLRQTRGPKASEYVKNAIEYISKHYPENVKIKELADFVGINRSYLASSFKKATGCSPKEYLLNLRMEKAKSLLETTQMPISSISSAVGYEDPLAFSRIFKRYSGLSPTDYREEHKIRFE